MKKLDKLFKSRSGIILELGCGEQKTDPNWVGIDVRDLPGVDIVHNLESYPWPIPDESCTLVHAAHILEHINPASTDPRLVGLIDLLVLKKVITQKEVTKMIGEYNIFGNFIRFMDEVWRVTKPGGKFHFVVPYGFSSGFQQDPTHLNPITETTVAYFAPDHPSKLWHFYKPKPWAVELNAFQTEGILEVMLRKITTPHNEKEKGKKS
jgi:hypothetical protein